MIHVLYCRAILKELVRAVSGLYKDVRALGLVLGVWSFTVSNVQCSGFLLLA